MTKMAPHADPSAAETSTDEAILAAAAHLFRERGFERATLRDIAKAAGVLPGSLHYRYPSKDALLVALMERAVHHVTNAIQAATANESDPRERLRHALRAHLRALLSGDDSVFVLMFEWRALRGESREKMVRLRDQYEAFWDGMLYAAAGAGELRAGIDLRLVRLFGFGAINWVATWYRESGALDADAIADAYWDFWARGLLARGGAPSHARPIAKPTQSSPREGEST